MFVRSLFHLFAVYNFQKWHSKNRGNVANWHSFLKTHIANDVFTVNQHSLTHLGYIVKSQGPLRHISARPLERLIGMTKSTVRSRRNPGQNAINEMNKSFAVNYYSRSVHESRSFLFPFSGSGTSTFRLSASKTLKLSFTSTEARAVQFQAALSKFFRRSRIAGNTIDVNDNNLCFQTYKHLTLYKSRCTIRPSNLVVVDLLVDDGRLYSDFVYNRFVATVIHIFTVPNHDPLCLVLIHRRPKVLETSCKKNQLYLSSNHELQSTEDKYAVISLEQVQTLARTIDWNERHPSVLERRCTFSSYKVDL